MALSPAGDALLLLVGRACAPVLALELPLACFAGLEKQEVGVLSGAHSEEAVLTLLAGVWVWGEPRKCEEAVLLPKDEYLI